MTDNKIVSTPAVAATQPVTHLNSPPQPVTGRVLKLALDVHLLEHVVAMQYDGSSSKPPQRFKPKDFPAWVQKQIVQGWQVIFRRAITGSNAEPAQKARKSLNLRRKRRKTASK